MQLVWFQEVSSDIAIATGSKALPACFRYDRSTLFMSQLEMQDKMFTFQCEDRIGTLKARPNERMKIESKIESKVSTARKVACQCRMRCYEWMVWETTSDSLSCVDKHLLALGIS